jgi:hypothetical protein
VAEHHLGAAPLRGRRPWTRFARWVSIAGHPCVVALVLIGALEARRGWAVAASAVAAVAILFVLPLLVLTARQVRRGAWGTVDASHPRERPMLFLVGGAGLVALLAYFALAHPGESRLIGAGAVLAMVALCAAVTPWLKVSLHLAAAGLAAAILTGRGHALGWVLAAALPVLAWSRVELGRHRWSEVLAGLLIGASTGAVVALLR